MARQRRSRAGLFKALVRKPHTQPRPVSPLDALAALQATIYDWDLASDALTWGPNAAEILGIAADSLPRSGRAFARLVEPGSGTGDRAAFFAGEAPPDTYFLRYALRFGADHVALVQDAGRWEPDAEGRPAAVHGLLRVDRAAGEALPAPLRARSGLLLRLNEDIADALRFSHAVTLVAGAVVDEDGAEVEEVLRRIRPMLRRRDRLALLGARRFALALSSCRSCEALGALKRLSGLAGTASLRLGAACAPDHALEATTLLRLAEQALDRALARGEGFVLHAARREPAEPARPWDHDPLAVLQALNARSLALTLRPVIDARTREPVFAEGRMGLPARRGETVPLAPLSALDGTNLPLLVDAHLLERAADHLVRDPAARLSLAVAPATLWDPEWLPMLASHLGARPGIESRLLIDVPEAALSRTAATAGLLNAMKALGIGIVLSGFGGGHASLAHLRVLPIDLLKIDGIFIQTLGRSTEDRLFVQRLVDLAQHLGIATLAERGGDETTARRLADWGVDYLEGPPCGAKTTLPAAVPPLVRSRRA